MHEMVRLLEPTHNERFQALMNRFMPKWQFRRETLDGLPVAHQGLELLTSLSEKGATDVSPVGQ